MKTKKEKEIKLLNKEAMTFSILYNNLLFFLIMVLFSFFIFSSTISKLYFFFIKNFNHFFSNYILSLSCSAGLLSFISTFQLH